MSDKDDIKDAFAKLKHTIDIKPTAHHVTDERIERMRRTGIPYVPRPDLPLGHAFLPSVDGKHCVELIGGYGSADNDWCRHSREEHGSNPMVDELPLGLIPPDEIELLREIVREYLQADFDTMPGYRKAIVAAWLAGQSAERRRLTFVEQTHSREIQAMCDQIDELKQQIGR